MMDDKYLPNVSYFYEIVDNSNIKLTIAHPGLSGNETRVQKQMPQLPSAVIAHISEVESKIFKKLGFQLDERVDVIKSIFDWTNKVEELNQEFGLAYQSNPLNFAFMYLNLPILDLIQAGPSTSISSQLLYESLFRLLNYDYYLKGERVGFSGNPFTYLNEGFIHSGQTSLVDMLPNLGTAGGASRQIEVEKHKSRSIASLVGDWRKGSHSDVQVQPLELFYLQLKNFPVTRRELLPVYFRDAFEKYPALQDLGNLGFVPPVDTDEMSYLRTESQDRLKQTLDLIDSPNYPKETTLPVGELVEPFQKRTQHCQKKLSEGLAIQEGFSSNFTLTYQYPEVDYNQQDLNLSKIFDSISTSSEIPFIRYSTGEKNILIKDEKGRNPPIVYNKIDVKFAQNNDYYDEKRTKITLWTNTNRRLHSNNIYDYNNIYTYYKSEAVIFELMIDENSYASVFFKESGSVLVIYNYVKYSDPLFLVNLITKVDNLLKRIHQIDGSFPLSKFSQEKAQELAKGAQTNGEIFTSTNIPQLINLEKYLLNTGYKVINMDFFIDLRWAENYSFDYAVFTNKYRERYSHFINERKVEDQEQLIQSKKGYYSTSTKQIVFLKQVTNYIDFWTIQRKGRPVTTSTTGEGFEVDERDLKKNRPLAIFDLRKYSDKCLRIVLSNLRHMDDLVVSIDFVKNSFQSYLRQIGIEDAEEVTIDDAEISFNILQGRANDEDTSIQIKEKYTRAIQLAKPKHDILTVIDPDIFGPKKDKTGPETYGSAKKAKREHQAFAIKNNRAFYRFYTHMVSLRDKILEPLKPVVAKYPGFVDFLNNLQRLCTVTIENIFSYVQKKITLHQLTQMLQANFNDILIQLLIIYSPLEQAAYLSLGTTIPTAPVTPAYRPIDSTPTRTVTSDETLLETISEVELTPARPDSIAETDAPLTGIGVPQTDTGDLFLGDDIIGGGFVDSEEDEEEEKPITGAVDQTGFVIETRPTKDTVTATELPKYFEVLNKLTYLLFLYRYGVEFNGNYYICIPEFTQILADGSLVEVPIFESEVIGGVRITAFDPLFEEFEVYDYSTDYVQYRPNTQHLFAQTFLRTLLGPASAPKIQVANAEVAQGIINYPDKIFTGRNAVVGFHIKEGIQTPKCYKYFKIGSGADSANEANKKRVLEQYYQDTAIDVVKTTEHTFTTYKPNFDKSAIGSHRKLPDEIVNKLNLTNYRLLIAGSGVSLNSFYIPFALLAGSPFYVPQFWEQLGHLGLGTIDHSINMVKGHVLKSLQAAPFLFYTVKSGYLPFIFGTPERFLYFLETSYVNEEFLWEIVTYPGILTAKGFNLYIIDRRDGYPVSLRVPDPVYKYREDLPNLVLLADEGGYNPIFQQEGIQPANYFHDQNSQLIRALNETMKQISPTNQKELPGGDRVIGVIEKMKASSGAPFQVDYSQVVLGDSNTLNRLEINVKRNNQTKFSVQLPISPTNSVILYNDLLVEPHKYRVGKLNSQKLELPDLLDLLDFLRYYASFDPDAYQISSLIALPQSDLNEEEIITGVELKNGASIFTKPVSSTDLPLMSSNLPVNHSRYNELIFSALMLESVNKAKLLPEVMFNQRKMRANLYQKVLQLLQQYLNQNIKASQDYQSILSEPDNYDKLRTFITSIIDQICHFGEFKDIPSTPEFPAFTLELLKRPPKTANESSQSCRTLDRPLEEKSPDGMVRLEINGVYKLFVPTNFLSKSTLVEFLVNDLLHNRYALSDPAEENSQPQVRESALENFSEIILDNDNTKLYLQFLKRYNNAQFISCLETNNYFMRLQRPQLSVRKDKVFFAEYSTFREIDLSGISGNLLYQNNLIEPNNPKFLFEVFLKYNRIPDPKPTVYTKIFDSLSERPELLRIYYYYYRYYHLQFIENKIKYEDETLKSLRPVEVEGTKKGATKISLAEIFTHVDDEKLVAHEPPSAGKIKFYDFVVNYGLTLPIDFYLVAMIYNLNIASLSRNEGTLTLFNYGTGEPERWSFLYQYDYHLYPIVMLDTLPDKSNVIKQTDLKSLLGPEEIKSVGLATIPYEFSTPYNAILKTLQTDPEAFSSATMALSSTPSLPLAPMTSTVFKRVISELPVVVMKTIPTTTGDIISETTTNPLSGFQVSLENQPFILALMQRFSLEEILDMLDPKEATIPKEQHDKNMETMREMLIQTASPTQRHRIVKQTRDILKAKISALTQNFSLNELQQLTLHAPEGVASIRHGPETPANRLLLGRLPQYHFTESEIASALAELTPELPREQLIEFLKNNFNERRLTLLLKPRLVQSPAERDQRQVDLRLMNVILAKITNKLEKRDLVREALSLQQTAPPTVAPPTTAVTPPTTTVAPPMTTVAPSTTTAVAPPTLSVNPAVQELMNTFSKERLEILNDAKLVAGNPDLEQQRELDILKLREIMVNNGYPDKRKWKGLITLAIRALS